MVLRPAGHRPETDCAHEAKHFLCITHFLTYYSLSDVLMFSNSVYSVLLLHIPYSVLLFAYCLLFI
jgi:hypothetical protein